MSSLQFSKLTEERFQEAYSLLMSVGEWIQSKGRQQRITNTRLETYRDWQAAGCNFTVESNHQFVGLVTLTREWLEDWPEFQGLGQVQMMRALATCPQHRGMGVGKFAVQNLIANYGAEPIYLDCVSEFLPGYYSALGFELLATRSVEKRVDSQDISYEICLMRNSRSVSR